MELVPSNNYNLVFIDANSKNWIAIECEFIKYYNNNFHAYYDDFNEQIKLLNSRKYFNQTERNKLINNLTQLTNTLVDGEIFSRVDGSTQFVDYPFDHPLYPYKNLFYQHKWQWTLNEIGLFKYIRAVKVMVNNIDYTSVFTGNNPMNITILSDIGKQAYTYNSNDYWYFQEYLNNFILYIVANTSISTRWSSSSNLIPNQTLFWTDITKFKIMESRIKERLIHEKTLTSLEEKLPRDITREIGKFVGSKEYVKKGGKKSKKYRKNKLKKVRKNKTKNRLRN